MISGACVYRLSVPLRRMIGAWGRSPLRRLHLLPQSGHGLLWCAGARFEGWSVPPRAFGSMWSSTSDPGCPHMWQVSSRRRRWSRSAAILRLVIVCSGCAWGVLWCGVRVCVARFGVCEGFGYSSSLTSTPLSKSRCATWIAPSACRTLTVLSSSTAVMSLPLMSMPIVIVMDPMGRMSSGIGGCPALCVCCAACCLLLAACCSVAVLLVCGAGVCACVPLHVCAAGVLLHMCMAWGAPCGVRAWPGCVRGPGHAPQCVGWGSVCVDPRVCRVPLPLCVRGGGVCVAGVQRFQVPPGYSGRADVSSPLHRHDESLVTSSRGQPGYACSVSGSGGQSHGYAAFRRAFRSQ